MRTGRIAHLLMIPALVSVFSCSDDRPPVETGPIELSTPRPVPGQTIRTTAKTIALGGRSTASASPPESSGTLALERVRIVEQTIAEETADAPGTFTLVVVEDNLKTTVRSQDGDRTDTAKSPLIGRPITATKDAEGKWKLQLTTGETGPAEEEELIPLEGFENRNWFPDRPVRPGDSWEYDPVYFRNLIERDLGTVAATGVMTLRSIDTSTDGERIARIDVTITSGHGETSENRAGPADAIEAAGSLVIDLETMLEKKLTIEGAFTSGASGATSNAPGAVPVRIELTREIVP